MMDYATWCRHYDYDPDSEEARRNYAEYERQHDIFSAIIDPGFEPRANPGEVLRLLEKMPGTALEKADDAQLDYFAAHLKSWSDMARNEQRRRRGESLR